jgi:hypothetical protein
LAARSPNAGVEPVEPPATALVRLSAAVERHHEFANEPGTMLVEDETRRQDATVFGEVELDEDVDGIVYAPVLALVLTLKTAKPSSVLLEEFESLMIASRRISVSASGRANEESECH